MVMEQSSSTDESGDAGDRNSDDPKRALSEIIHPLGEQCDVSPLVLYKLVPKVRAQNCIDRNLLPKEDCDGWHIALREQLNEAVQREIKYAGHVGKDSHVVLRVTFHPLGIAFFTTSCGDQVYQFKPVLHKVAYGGPLTGVRGASSATCHCQ